MPRPVWSGTISFGLVTIPVKLFHAVSRKNVSFNQLDDRSMSRIRMKKVSAETGEDVPDEHIVKGYEFEGTVRRRRPDELEPFILVATKAIDLEEFVDLADIDPVFFDTPYIVAPDNSAKPYMLLTKAMEDAGKVAVGTFVMRSKQYVAALRPVDGRLMLSTMAFADEVVDPGSIDELGDLEDVKIGPKELAMAEQLVESLAGAFEPERFTDSYREQVLELIAKKAAGEAFEAPEPAAAAPQVIDLMAALEASVKAAKEARASSGHREGRPRRLSGRRGRSRGAPAPRRPAPGRASPPSLPARGRPAAGGDRRRAELSLSNLDKVLYPETGTTKGEVIEYYARIAPTMLPHLAGRALTFNRFPNGVEHKGFFEKRCAKHRPEWMPTAPGPGDHNGTIEYCVIDEPAALVWAANMAALELHAPMALAEDLDTPRMVVFDLDPGPPAAIRECARTAPPFATSSPPSSSRRGRSRAARRASSSTCPSTRPAPTTRQARSRWPSASSSRNRTRRRCSRR